MPQLYLLHWRDEEFVLIGKRGEAPYDPTDNARRFVGYSESMPMARRYFRTCWGIAAPAPVLTVPDMRTVASAVRAGAGLAVVPMYIAQQGIADGSPRSVAHSAEAGAELASPGYAPWTGTRTPGARGVEPPRHVSCQVA
ncbi:type 2 periplasmic-binding domain-containing protein [Kibdelosporangium aridum]|uniref:hypothetical protein n=1 Tax=Kibdelosporangium aridum TaxID=2030 RepID=UPI00190E939E|nr:hypothetical protein [Kibdelosporangium aridum]